MLRISFRNEQVRKSNREGVGGKKEIPKGEGGGNSNTILRAGMSINIFEISKGKQGGRGEEY